MRNVKPVAQPNRLKVLRAVFGLDQYEVADLLQINRSRYCFIEKGKTQPSDEERQKIAKLFNKSVEYIFTPLVAA